VVAGIGFSARGILSDGAEPLPPITIEGVGDMPARLVADTTIPIERAELLWLDGRMAQRGSSGTRAVFDASGRLLTVDDRLRLSLPKLQLEGRVPEGATQNTDGGWWIATSNGALVRTDSAGRIVRELPAPYEFTGVVSDHRTGGVWTLRSPRDFNFRWDTLPAPVITRLDQNGDHAGTLGSLVVPAHVLMTELANTGHVEVLGDTLFYAPFIRDQLIAFTPNGDTLWVASRNLPQSTAEPRLVIEDGTATMDYYPVNLGLTVGPDRRLYLLSTPGFTTIQSRLDVFDPSTGTLLWTAEFDTSIPTLAVNARGRLYQFDPFSVLSGISVADREGFAPFSLDVLSGGHMSTDDLIGKVTLINFWASWCAPCRIEMPALDSLHRSISDTDFHFITMNEDENPADAEAFLDEFGFDFPALLGMGALKHTYYYRGLPFTVLLDRNTNVVQRWIGYTGEEQIELIRSVIEAELAREGEGSGSHGGDGGHDHSARADPEASDHSEHRH
jgi:thiol-disulfide isomerase/thioredoxin